MPMENIYSLKNLKNIEKTIIPINQNNTIIDKKEIQPSEQTIKTILNYSKSICVLKSPKKRNLNICNIN